MKWWVGGIESWSEQSKKNQSLTHPLYSQFPIVLTGNKCDLENERVVGQDEAKKQAEQWGIPHIETSAKENIRVNDAFYRYVKRKEEGGVIRKKATLSFLSFFFFSFCSLSSSSSLLSTQCRSTNH
jgi:GTPase SAR1 family protein